MTARREKIDVKKFRNIEGKISSYGEEEEEEEAGDEVAESGEKATVVKTTTYRYVWRRIGAPGHVYAIFRRKLNS